MKNQVSVDKTAETQEREKLTSSPEGCYNFNLASGKEGKIIWSQKESV